MAGFTRLSGMGLRLLALLAVVLVLHMLALEWLALQLEAAPRLRPLATPMFTRLLQPDAVVEPPKAVTAKAPPRPKSSRVAVSSIGPQRQAPAAPAASAPTGSASAAAVPAGPSPPTPQETIAAASALDTPSPASVASAASTSAPASTPASSPASSPASVPPTASGSALASASVPSAPASSAAAAMDSWPADTRLSYRLGGRFRSGDLHGSARVQWQRQGDRYETRVEIDVTLLVALVLTSQGEVTAQGLFPRAYEELRRSGPRGAKLRDDTIVLNDGRSVPRPAGVQDTASQFVELSHRFATGQERLEIGRTVNVWLARPGAVDLWTYDIVEREVLQTQGLGPIEAFRLKPRPIANPRGNITAEMWFAPSLQYLPVRIRVSMGEEASVDLMVEKIEQR